MKKITFIIAFFTITVVAKAQDFTKSLDGIEWVKIESKGDIVIRTHDSKQLLIKGGSSYKTPNKAKGLKLLGGGGTDNTDVGFSVIKEGNNLIVRNLRKSENAEIYLPASQNISVKSTWHGNIKIVGFNAEIEANAQLNGSVFITDVTGPITANSLNGEVEVSFTKVSQESPITIHSTNGELAVSLPESTPANLSLYSINGDIYTNFELNMPDKDGMKAISSKKVKGSINNGGVKIDLNTVNGNIYLKKQ